MFSTPNYFGTSKLHILNFFGLKLVEPSQELLKIRPMDLIAFYAIPIDHISEKIELVTKNKINFTIKMITPQTYAPSGYFLVGDEETEKSILSKNHKLVDTTRISILTTIPGEPNVSIVISLCLKDSEI